MQGFNISNVGWAVIAFLGILVFIILMRRGARIGVGDSVFSVSKTMDKKFSQFKVEIEKKEKARLHDEELRKKLFRQSGAIDEKMKADYRRVVRVIFSKAKDVFSPYIKCELPGMMAADIIRDELTERVDYNCVKEKLNKIDRNGYLEDIVSHIEKEYERFLLRLPNLPCHQEAYPSWTEIKPEIKKLVELWADENIKITIKRSKEKIKMYELEKSNFTLQEYIEFSVNHPIKKNKSYINGLGGDL